MAKQTNSQVTIMIVKAARAAGKMDIVDIEALLAEISASNKMATITANEVADLVAARYPTVKEAKILIDADGEAGLSLERLMRDMGAKIPSGRRILVSFVASFITGACVGYAGSMALAWLLAGAILLGAGAFLTFLITVLVWLLTIIGMYLAGKKVGTYIITGRIDEHFASVKNGASSAWNWVTSPFRSSDDELATA